MSGQLHFDPLQYGFRWTDDGWYEFDAKSAEKAARDARAREAKRLRQEGYNVKLFSTGRQLRSRGGIGSEHPHIEVIATGYYLNYSK